MGYAEKDQAKKAGACWDPGIRRQALDIWALGVLNVHCSMLPKHRSRGLTPHVLRSAAERALELLIADPSEQAWTGSLPSPHVHDDGCGGIVLSRTPAPAQEPVLSETGQPAPRTPRQAARGRLPGLAPSRYASPPRPASATPSTGWDAVCESVVEHLRRLTGGPENPAASGGHRPARSYGCASGIGGRRDRVHQGALLSSSSTTTPSSVSGCASVHRFGGAGAVAQPVVSRRRSANCHGFFAAVVKAVGPSGSWVRTPRSRVWETASSEPCFSAV